SAAVSCRLDRRFKPMADSLLRLARRFGPYRITSGCRTMAEQERLYANFLEGRSAFPVAPPGSSAHQRGLAVDTARRDVHPSLALVFHAIGASCTAAVPSLRWKEPHPHHFEVRPNILLGVLPIVQYCYFVHKLGFRRGGVDNVSSPWGGENSPRS